MNYIIKRTDGTLVIPGGLQENTIDNTTTPLSLIGKLMADYGEAQSNNFIHLMEHFAYSEPPSNPMKGLIWFNTTDNTVYICIAENPAVWKKFAFVTKDAPSNPDTGDFWYDTSKHQLFVFDDTIDDWVCIGPTDINTIQEGTSETTSNSSGNAVCNIPITKDSTNNIEIRIVGREIIPEDYIGLREPEVVAWNLYCIVTSYAIDEGGLETQKMELVDLANQPFTQKLGSTNYADSWSVQLVANNNTGNLQVKLSGKGIKQTDGSGGLIKWKVYYKIVKVM